MGGCGYDVDGGDRTFTNVIPGLTRAIPDPLVIPGLTRAILDPLSSFPRRRESGGMGARRIRR